MSNERQTHQISPTSQWTLSQITPRPDLVGKGDSILHCVCRAEVSVRARFCPHCGRLLAHELAQLTTTAISAPTTTRLSVATGSRTEARQLLTEATTLKEADWVPPLPPKYKESLQSDTAPELVIWDMFKRIITLRSLLEEVLISLPLELKNGYIEHARAFLRRHCASCGDVTQKADSEETPVCDKCRNL